MHEHTELDQEILKIESYVNAWLEHPTSNEHFKKVEDLLDFAKWAGISLRLKVRKDIISNPDAREKAILATDARNYGKEKRDSLVFDILSDRERQGEAKLTLRGGEDRGKKRLVLSDNARAFGFFKPEEIIGVSIK